MLTCCAYLLMWDACFGFVRVAGWAHRVHDECKDDTCPFRVVLEVAGLRDICQRFVVRVPWMLSFDLSRLPRFRKISNLVLAENTPYLNEVRTLSNDQQH